MDPYTQFVNWATNSVAIPSRVGVRQQRLVARRVSGSRAGFSGLGQITSTANVPGEISSTASLVGAGTSLAAATGVVAATSWVPIAGAVVAALAGIAVALGLGEGCGNSCISAAEQEQVYEAAGDNIAAVAKAGMLPGTVAAEIIQELSSMCAQAEAAQGTSQAKAGASNASTDLTAQANNMNALGDTVTQTLNLSTVSSLFIPTSTSGWYANSLATAQQLTMQILEQYASEAPSTTTTASGQTITTVTGAGLSTTDILLIGGALLAVVMFM